MKVQLLSLAMVIIMATGLSGQKPRKNKRIEAMRIAFITSELQLTEGEAQKFWPVYNAYRAEQKTLFQNDNRPDLDNLSEGEARKVVNEWVAREKKLIALKEDYLQRSLEVLPATKVAKLIAAEEHFKRKLLGRLKNKPPRPPHPPKRRK